MTGGYLRDIESRNANTGKVSFVSIISSIIPEVHSCEIGKSIYLKKIYSTLDEAGGSLLGDLLNYSKKVFITTVGNPPWPSGYDACLPGVSSQVRVSAGSPSGLAWSLYKCVAV